MAEEINLKEQMEKEAALLVQQGENATEVEIVVEVVALKEAIGAMDVKIGKIAWFTVIPQLAGVSVN